MFIVVKKSLYDKLSDEGFIEKSVSKKYIKREGTPGHYKYWYRNPDGSISIRGTDANGKKFKTKGHEDKKNKKVYPKPQTHTIGDIVTFKGDKGKIFSGKITQIKPEGVVINGNNGIQYYKRHQDVKVTKPVNSNDSIRYLMDENNIKPVWRNTDGLQPKSCDTIQGLYKTIEAARGEFNNFTDSVVDKFKTINPIVMKRATLKNEARIKEKLREDELSYKKGCEKTGNLYVPQNYDVKTDTYHCRTIRDCDGHTICLNSIKEVGDVLKYLNNRGEVARIKNNFAKPSSVGYSDINCNIKLSNGAIVELQVNTTANMVAKERYGHALYEVYRSVISKPEYKELADLMGKAQIELYKLSNKYSKEGNFPIDNIPKGKDGNINIFAGEYKHTPFANAIKSYINDALPIYKKAKAAGVLNDKTIEHFEHLVDYIK